MKQTRSKIALIDDDRELVEELKSLLESSGFEAVVVKDEKTALETIRKTTPDLVLLDLKMPKKTGVQIADEIRHAPEVCHVPIIAMSAFYKDAYADLLNSCGINKCLTKPLQPDDVIGEIKKFIY